MIGRYFPIHKEKYSGELPLIYKSKLEYKMMLYLDRNPNIIQWGYEKFSIKYVDKSSNPPKVRNYHIDFVAIAKSKEGPKTLWIEVKQSSETHKPLNESDTRAMKTWIKNLSKWKQAEITAREKNAEFKIITEKQLN